MRRIAKISVVIFLAWIAQAHVSEAQKVDDERMKRDIAVAENVLATLIKHEMEQQRTLFGLDVQGSYQPGNGVTFRVPADHSVPFVMSFSDDQMVGTTVTLGPNGYRYSEPVNGNSENDRDSNQLSLVEKAKAKQQSLADSSRNHYNDRIIAAAQNFILDYGDMLSQLSPDERIVVTNQSEGPYFYFSAGKRTRISVEGTRADITDLRQGKISREQAIKKLKVLNTESIETRQPDMEMLSSIFTRLYRPDLSRTYFVQGNVYYERLKDFGAVFYMRMLSSEESSPNRFIMPTLRLQNLDLETRNKKVAELYAEFEREMKDNIMEYGRTLKSLNDDESLIFNIVLTKCPECGIPATLELSVKGSVLREFGAGKIDKVAAVNKISVKKGESQ